MRTSKTDVLDGGNIRADRLSIEKLMQLAMQYNQHLDALEQLSGTMRPRLTDRVMELSTDVTLSIADGIAERLGTDAEDALNILEEARINLKKGEPT